MTAEELVPVKGTRYDVSSLRKNQQDIYELEALLLAWTILLYRHSNGNHIQYSWGLCEVGSNTCHTFELSTSHVPLSAVDSVSTALRNVRRYLREQVQSPAAIAVDRYVLLLNDECAPGNSFAHVNKDGDLSMNWGNIQLQAGMADGGLWLRPLWREPMGAEFLSNHFAQSLVEILNTTLIDANAPISSVLQLGNLDQSVIWGWNKDVPSTAHICIHDLIAEQVLEQPGAPAISSWDGDFTYEEVDRHSNLLAHHLIGLGVQTREIVPLCFEKSRWTTIAVMAVIKAGAAFVLMDPSQPLQRRQAMVAQVNASLILTSEDQAQFAAEIVPGGPTVIVNQDMLLSLAGSIKASRNDFPYVHPDSLLYIIFTSGSTGTPKGAMISHATYSTSALARSTAIGYSKTSRSLDFTSYAFDVSIDSILCTLLRGGCLCIPTDMDRVNDLSGAIRRFKVNMVNVTPSVARILDADIIPSLQSLGIGGESCSAGDISIWGQHTRVVVGYGPAECTIGCTVNPSAAGKPYVSVGSGTGAVIWLADPENHDRLVPVGAVGELLVEGPIVGQGYLGDPEKTAAAIIHDPKFLLNGGGGVPGRRGRLYKTGDLVRYDPDGERGFVFVGRKDTQVKLRGQRVELGEVEHHIKNLLPPGSEVVAEIIAPPNQDKKSMLVAFIADRNAAVSDGECPRQIELPPRLCEMVESLSERLSKLLPIYMVPATYIPLSKIPMLVSGKTDRKFLRALGASISTSVQASFLASQDNETVREPQSEAELFLRDSWSRLLGLEADRISTTHNFFMLGGESVLAMKLVPVARKEGFTLSVTDVFSHPVLSDMAKVMQRTDNSSQVNMEVPAFSLLGLDIECDSLCVEAAEQCGCEKTSIEDIYPCAPMQEIHIAFYTRSKENYIAQRVADIPRSSSIDQLKRAWDTVYRESAILRTRIVEFKHHGFMQVVVNQNLQWEEINTSLDMFLEKNKKEPMPPGAPLCRFAIIRDETLDKRYFVWTVHHAIYDGWSTDLLLEHAKAAYHGIDMSRLAEFKHFIRYLGEPSKESSKDYWRAQLDGATGARFPSLPSRSYIPDPNSLAERFIALESSTKSDITIATIIRAAWALLASRYSLSDDVVIGETAMGRTIPLPGVEQIEGPILATVPVRIRLDRTTSVQEFLHLIQDQSIARAAHDHLGLQHIRRLSPDAQIACEVTTGLVIQPMDPDVPKLENDELPSFRSGDAALEALHFNSYALMLACSLQKDGFRLLAGYDSTILSQPQVQRLLLQFECAVSQLRGDQSQLLSSITCLGEKELREIWEVNKVPPVSPSEISRFLTSGDTYPTVKYTPWIVHSTNENLLVPIGAVGELLLEGAAVGEAPDAGNIPEWLKQGAEGIPGRQGRLYHTGDLVKYADDMSIVFVGRKETIKTVDGHVINLAATDLELKRLLPQNVDASSRLILPKGSTNQTPIVVAFIQETPLKDTRMVDLCVDTGHGACPLAHAISVELATAIIGLNKTMVEILPPHAIPSICIPISKITGCGESLNFDSVNDIAEHITLAFVTELRKGFAILRRSISQAIPMTAKERVLRSLWSKFLSIEEDKLSLDDNFFRLGGDSIVAMRMVSAVRRDGYRLSVASIFQNMQLGSMANALVEAPIEPSNNPKEYSPFSLLDVGDIGSFLSENVRPQLADSSWKVRDVLPATDPQSRDVRATVSAHRSSVQYTMLYLEDSIDASRLLESFQYLISRHDILRTVFIQHNDQILQVIVEDMKLPITERVIEGSLDSSCKELAETDIDVDSAFVFGAPFLHLFVLRGNKEKALMIRISHAQYDGFSLPELIRQLELRYRGLDVTSSAPFANYLHYLHSTRTENIKYWRSLLQGSPRTEIIAPADPNSKTTFITRTIDVSGSSPDTTLAMLLTAGWARVLSQFLNISDVTFGGIVSGRDVDIPGVDAIMGPCYQYMPVRVKFEPMWTATQILGHVRDQYIEGSQRSTLGFKDILQECTNWSATTPFYGSFTNHLNREYFDTIPFAGTKCRIDYTIPHAEPPTPPRVVSFVESGQTCIGIEADEDRREFWEARLNELTLAIEGFVTSPQELLQKSSYAEVGGTY